MNNKAMELEKNLDLNGALHEYKHALNNNPDNTILLGKIGWCQSRQGLYDEAIETFCQLSSMEPYKAQWYYMVGFQHYSKQKWIDAIEWFRKALDKYPRYYKVKYRLAYALIRQSGDIYRLRKPEYIEAYKILDECIAEWSTLSDSEKENEKATFADMFFQKGKIHNEKSEWKIAVGCFNEALKLKPEEFDYKYQLSKALFMDNNPAEALKMLPLDNRKYYVRELKANILNALGNIEQALEMLQKELQKRKRDYLFREIAEIYLTGKGDAILAYGNIQKALSIRPHNHLNHLLLSQVYASVGLFVAALKEVDTAIELKDKNFGGPFLDAEKFKANVESKIMEINHVEDDEIIFARLVGKQESMNVMEGLVKNYKPDKGYGFIATPSLNVFFHITEVCKSNHSLVKEGQRVAFRVEQALKGPIAKDVKVII